jgi:hypothetical protein
MIRCLSNRYEVRGSFHCVFMAHIFTVDTLACVLAIIARLCCCAKLELVRARLLQHYSIRVIRHRTNPSRAAIPSRVSVRPFLSQTACCMTPIPLPYHEIRVSPCIPINLYLLFLPVKLPYNQTCTTSHRSTPGHRTHRSTVKARLPGIYSLTPARA